MTERIVGVRPLILLQTWLTTLGWSIEYRLSSKGEISKGGDGGGIQNGNGNMDNGHYDIQAKGNTLLCWLKDSCKDNRLSSLQIQYQLSQRSLAYGLFCIAQDPEIRRLLR